MLDKNTIKWLEERKDKHHKCRICTHLNGDKTFCQYVRAFLGGWCYFDSENQDWQDAAEFEARVAAKLADDVESFFEIKDFVSNPISWKENTFLRLKYARLDVEKEMDDA